jgi:hypothetical protein
MFRVGQFHRIEEMVNQFVITVGTAPRSDGTNYSETIHKAWGVRAIVDFGDVIDNGAGPAPTDRVTRV